MNGAAKPRGAAASGVISTSPSCLQRSIRRTEPT
jgi:hypothetical protein